jgi:hypothetical protein
MNEILLQTMIDKMDQMTKILQVLKEKIDSIPDHSEDFKKLQGGQQETMMEVKSMPSQISIPVNDIIELKDEAIKLKSQLKEPLVQKVKHVYHLSKPVLGSILLVIIILWLMLWLWHEMDAVSRMKENDIKYRMLNLSFDNNLTRSIHLADSLFLDDPGKLSKEVQAEEKRRSELLNGIQRSSRKTGENIKTVRPRH